MNAADPRNPMFYVSTFLTNAAMGIIDPQDMTMDALLDGMREACSASAFDPDRCATLSATVGRIRTQDACSGAGTEAGVIGGPAGGSSAGYLPPLPLHQTPLVSGAAALSAVGPSYPQVGPATLTAALAAIGSGPRPSVLAACGNSTLSKIK
jgi:hypothetical protein